MLIMMHASLSIRFHQDRQKQQLSMWVRHRVGKFSQMLPALQSFRSFISAAMSDPELALTVSCATTTEIPSLTTANHR